MRPCVVLDLETTGFPNNGSGFCGRILELGAVVITADRRVVSPISFLVRQPRRHLQTWQARKATQVHGLSEAEILRRGLDPAHAAPRLAQWIERVRERHGIVEARAYNQGFDFWFLERDPWDFFARTGLQRGEDIQVVAQRAMGVRKGPKLAAAVSHAQAQGASLAWASRAHRACEDARMAALVALALGD